jgi:hypothetical protein
VFLHSLFPPDCMLQVIYHGNLNTLRDMTDVADSSRVMVDLIEVSLPFC